MTMADQWFVGASTKPGSGASVPFVVSFPSKADFVRRYGDPIAGPFATKAQADAWVRAHKGTFGPGTTGGLPGSGDDSILPSVPNPFSWTGAIAHWIGKVALDITDVHMWISLGWILLGIVLMVLGVYLIIRLSEPYAKANAAVTGAITKAV